MQLNKIVMSYLCVSALCLQAQNEPNENVNNLNDQDLIEVTVTNNTDIPFTLISGKLLAPGLTETYIMHRENWKRDPFVVTHDGSIIPAFSITASKLFNMSPTLRISQAGKNRYVLETLVKTPTWQKVPTVRKKIQI